MILLAPRGEVTDLRTVLQARQRSASAESSVDEPELGMEAETQACAESRSRSRKEAAVVLGIPHQNNSTRPPNSPSTGRKLTPDG